MRDQLIIYIGLVVIIIYLYLWYKVHLKAKESSAPPTVIQFPKPTPAPLKVDVPVTKEDSNQIAADRLTWINSVIKDFDNTKSLLDLLSEKEIGKIKYSDLLLCVEWRFKRFTILIRDRFTCRDCGGKSASNHVHHKYYLKDKLPWDIADTALITLCQKCHANVHENEVIKVRIETAGLYTDTDIIASYCSRCNGSGYLPQYSHVQNGICFKCEGDSIRKTIFSSALLSVNNNKKDYDIYRVRFKSMSFTNAISYEEFKNLPSSCVKKEIKVDYLSITDEDY